MRAHIIPTTNMKRKERQEPMNRSTCIHNSSPRAGVRRWRSRRRGSQRGLAVSASGPDQGCSISAQGESIFGCRSCKFGGDCWCDPTSRQTHAGVKLPLTSRYGGFEGGLGLPCALLTRCCWHHRCCHFGAGDVMRSIGASQGQLNLKSTLGFADVKIDGDFNFLSRMP